jgi:AbrB family looped-hinge helix DNA binding protein
MTTRITPKGQVTVPSRLRKALQLSAGDAVEFHLKDNGELVLRKAAAAAGRSEKRAARLHLRLEEQRRRRAQELIELLRGLD